MTMHVKVSGVWKEIRPAHVNVSGTWKEFTEGWVKVSGTWKQFYQSILVNVIGGSAVAAALAPNAATASWRLNSSGIEERGVANSGTTTFTNMNTWLIAGAAGDYECMMSMVSGDPFAGTLLDTWLPCSTSRLWSLSETSSSGFKSGLGTLSIRRASDSLLLDSAVVSLSASVDP